MLGQCHGNRVDEQVVTWESLAKEAARFCLGSWTSGTASASATAALCSCAKAAVYLGGTCIAFSHASLR